MHKDDIALLDIVDLPAALGLLTRLPVALNTERATARGAAAVWTYPLVGALMGVILASAAALMNAIGLPHGIIAALVLALSVILTGAMHEDGLADSADGLWGGWEPARRLEIMKDSHIGVYGVCAIALTLLLRWMALTLIVSLGAYWTALIVVGALSRTGMVGLMAILPHARSSGLSHAVGRPPERAVWLALAIAAVIALLCGFLWLIPVALIAALSCAAIARMKIGGQTGDILGATQQITEIAMLLALTVLLP
ncbi:adenosylcobinamide-GDP ribazoletransferase [Yoonia sp. BS5-3]|uniref:Adenosylcobinamide-GDP ribazoletransferase n=1 Tax=Yoonia phaeophyticola TaxID=3137369 RepID=A0ABZ2V024_9RHOB